MALFLLFYVPAFFIFFLAFEKKDRYGWYKAYNWKEAGLFFVKGCVIFAVALIFYMIAGNIFTITYRPAGYFYFYFFLNHLINWAALLGGYYFFKALDNVRKSKQAMENFLAYLTGFYFFNSLYLIITKTGESTFLFICFFPLLNWAMIIYSALMVAEAYLAYGIPRVLYIGGAVLFPVIAATILYLYVLNYFFIACGLGIVYFIGSFLLYQHLKIS
jgi:hypothetical protein